MVGVRAGFRDLNDAEGDSDTVNAAGSAGAGHRESLERLLNRLMAFGVCLYWRKSSTNRQNQRFKSI